MISRLRTKCDACGFQPEGYSGTACYWCGQGDLFSTKEVETLPCAFPAAPPTGPNPWGYSDTAREDESDWEFGGTSDSLRSDAAYRVGSVDFCSEFPPRNGAMLVRCGCGLLRPFGDLCGNGHQFRHATFAGRFDGLRVAVQFLVAEG